MNIVKRKGRVQNDFHSSVITALVGPAFRAVIQPCAHPRPMVRRKSSEVDCRDKPDNDEWCGSGRDDMEGGTTP